MTEHLAILKKEGKRFEIDVDPDLAMELREGKDISISEILKAENIFSSVKKGDLASSKDLISVFKTDDVLEVAKEIILHGDVQASQKYRENHRSQKKKEIVNLIHRNAVDPSTDLPHPIVRIESAMDESKIRIDENKSAIDQIDEIIKKLRVILPIRIESKVIDITIPANYAGKAYGQIAGYGNKKKENWNNDGSLSLVIEIPAGIELDLYDKVNSITHGEAEINVIETNKK